MIFKIIVGLFFGVFLLKFVLSKNIAFSQNTVHALLVGRGVLLKLLSLILIAGLLGFAYYKSVEVVERIRSSNPYVDFNLRRTALQTSFKIGVPVVQNMAIDQLARVEMENLRYPNLVWPCPKIIEPKGLDLEKLKFEVVAGAHTNVNVLGLDEASLARMRKFAKTMRVEITGVVVNMNVGNPCAHLK